jgi:hypothetical protein
VRSTLFKTKTNDQQRLQQQQQAQTLLQSLPLLQQQQKYRSFTSGVYIEISTHLRHQLIKIDPLKLWVFTF